MSELRNQFDHARKHYAAQKYRHCHSKRDYYRWKDNYIADILESL